MDAAEQLAAEILEAIGSGRDLYVFDQFIAGSNRLERSRKVLIEKRDACSDPDEPAFLTSIIRAGWKRLTMVTSQVRPDAEGRRTKGVRATTPVSTK
jgi:hypothetical protein